MFEAVLLPLFTGSRNLFEQENHSSTHDGLATPVSGLTSLGF